MRRGKRHCELIPMAWRFGWCSAGRCYGVRAEASGITRRPRGMSRWVPLAAPQPSHVTSRLKGRIDKTDWKSIDSERRRRGSASSSLDGLERNRCPVRTVERQALRLPDQCQRPRLPIPTPPRRHNRINGFPSAPSEPARRTAEDEAKRRGQSGWAQFLYRLHACQHVEEAWMWTLTRNREYTAPSRNGVRARCGSCGADRSGSGPRTGAATSSNR
jgi:hypothetical protein